MTPTIQDSKLIEINTWMGQYRGIPFEVRQNKKPIIGSGFTYYIFLFKKLYPLSPFEIELRPPDSSGRCWPDYYKHPVYSQIWFHYGITYGNNEPQNDEAIVKLGCDYAHYGDEDQHTIHDIIYDVEHTINSFREIVPGYKCRCGGNGTICAEEEGGYISGRFYSRDYARANPGCAWLQVIL